MSDLARMIEWVKNNPEAAARELIDMEKRISQAERQARLEKQLGDAATEENARLRELIDARRSDGSGQT